MHLNCLMCLFFCGLCSAFFFLKDKGKTPIFCLKICPLYCPKSNRRHDTGSFYLDDYGPFSSKEDISPLDYELFHHSRFVARHKPIATTTTTTTTMKPPRKKHVPWHGTPWHSYRGHGSEYFYDYPSFDDYEFHPSLHHYVHIEPVPAWGHPSPHPTTSTTTTTTMKPDPTFICELCKAKC